MAEAVSFSACAGEVLFSQNFDGLDLNKLPVGYTVTNPQNLSVVDEAGRGKVLKIANTKQGDYSTLSVVLDAAKVKGHSIRIAAMAKFPGNFTPIPGKDYARPKVLIACKDKDGKDIYPGGDQLQPNKPEWVQSQNIVAIPGDIQSATASLRVEETVAEVWFDDFSVELDPDPKSAPPATVAAAGPAGGSLASKAPKKALEEGVLFNPDIAAGIEKNRVKTTPTANTIFYAGPGLPMKELDGKKIDKWSILPTKELTGLAASPRNLLSTLPEALAQNKAEVVVLFGDFAPGRKPSSSEALDWEDLARLCLRMGVVPVLAVPPLSGQEQRDQLHNAMIDAANGAGCPAIDLKAPSFVPRRISELTVLLDKFVFARVPPDAPTTGSKKPDGSPEE